METKQKINIQWYPGHMTKAKREMQEKLNMVDMVIELRDARIPGASKNPLIDELCKQKPRLIILSKKDKANEAETRKWIQKLSSDHVQVIALDIIQEQITPKIIQAAQSVMKAKIDKQISRGIRPRAIRAMVAGVPNVGKSTFINRIAKRKIAQTGDRPGVTRALQWAKVGSELELLDTPGVLWPKFEDERVGLLLAVSGAIRDEILPLEDVAVWAIKYLMDEYPTAIEQRYGIETSRDPYEMLMRIGRKRNMLLNGNEVDWKRTIDTFMKELRQDKLGRITWEKSNADGE